MPLKLAPALPVQRLQRAPEVRAQQPLEKLVVHTHP